ncbi:unnamed protein product, partial [Brassica rapa subsp. trilocularis]
MCKGLSKIQETSSLSTNMPPGQQTALPFEDKGEKGCTVREGGPDDGCESEHGVVHVSRGVDNLHTNPLILVAPRSLRLPLLTSPISPYCSLFHFNLLEISVTYHWFHWKKGTPFGEDQGDLQQVDNGNQLTPNRNLSHNRLSTSYALRQHTGRFCYGRRQIPTHAQGPHFWNHCRPMK